MLAILALLNSDAAASCPTEQIVANAQVQTVNRSSWPDYPKGPAPDKAMVAQRQATAFAALGLKPLTLGLIPERSISASWDALSCQNVFVESSNGAQMSDGRIIRLGPSNTIVVGEATVPVREQNLLEIDGAHLATSTYIMISGWRVGVWQFADGHSLLAAFRTDGSSPPIRIMSSDSPVRSISYLGAPDTWGGQFTVIQEVGRNALRWSYINWSEYALRSLDKAG